MAIGYAKFDLYLQQQGSQDFVFVWSGTDFEEHMESLHSCKCEHKTLVLPEAT